MASSARGIARNPVTWLDRVEFSRVDGCVVLAGTRWYRGANICATVLVGRVRILFWLLRSIALPDKYGMERVEMWRRGSAARACSEHGERTVRKSLIRASNVFSKT